MTIPSTFIIAFLILAALNILAVGSKFKPLQYVSQLLIVPSLILYYLFSIRLANIDILIVSGLICCAIGSYFLIYQEDETKLLLGIFIILLANILYTISFLRSIETNVQYPWWKFTLLIPPTFILVYTILRIKGKTEVFSIPAFLYIGLVYLMCVSAVLRLPTNAELAYFLVWLGSIFFLFSVAISAIDSFRENIPRAGLFVRISYLVAQFLITQGMIFTSFI
ncbi:MAG: hypothetical protein GF383_13760 [Candidatus Lokiarchaeota archaeon]|nr:hypothetical protein [Candidatus Lokiarchaeota archaeon]MBD3342337.1 hypothetical protein [Candidatus Lokiarchaeota archaeon]